MFSDRISKGFCKFDLKTLETDTATLGHILRIKIKDTHVDLSVEWNYNVTYLLSGVINTWKIPCPQAITKTCYVSRTLNIVDKLLGGLPCLPCQSLQIVLSNIFLFTAFFEIQRKISNNR